MIVITKGYTQISGALAKISQQPAQPLIIRRSDLAVFGPLVSNLQIQSTGIMDKLCVGHMFGNLFSFHGRLNAQASAGKRNHQEPARLQEIAQLRGAAKFFNGVGAQLYPWKAECGNIVNALAVVGAPGDTGGSNSNLTRR